MHLRLCCFLFLFSWSTYAQTENTSALYYPEADALQQIELAAEKAKSENKNILIQVGGNWCSWCIKLHNFIEDHPELDSIITADFELIRINYSKENKNFDVMEMLGFPNRFGFPVLVVLNEDGNRIHTQNTAYLEENNLYSERKVKEFLLSWNKKALDAGSYKK